ncbi:hypothetical protein Q4O60_14490 [Aeribacillus pallidus]|nr:hypothetical protein [Aeribacillus pallidus]
MAFEKEKAALLEIVSESLKREKFKHINTEKIKINKREGGKKRLIHSLKNFLSYSMGFVLFLFF